MLDFSKDIIDGTVDIQGLTAAEDQELFSNIRSGEVKVGLNVIDAPNAKDIIVPVEKNGQKFELAFFGRTRRPLLPDRAGTPGQRCRFR